MLNFDIPQRSKEERALRAEEAKRLLADPFFQSMVEEAEAMMIAEWRRNTNPEARERCWLTCQGLDLILNQILRVVAESPPPEKD